MQQFAASSHNASPTDASRRPRHHQLFCHLVGMQPDGSYAHLKQLSATGIHDRLSEGRCAFQWANNLLAKNWFDNRNCRHRNKHKPLYVDALMISLAILLACTLISVTFIRISSSLKACPSSPLKSSKLSSPLSLKRCTYTSKAGAIARSKVSNIGGAAHCNAAVAILST